MADHNTFPKLPHVVDDDPDIHAQVDELTMHLLTSEIPGFAILTSLTEEDIDEIAASLNAKKPKGPVGVLPTHKRHRNILQSTAQRLSYGLDKKINSVTMQANRAQSINIPAPNQLAITRLLTSSGLERNLSKSLIVVNTVLREANLPMFLASVDPSEVTGDNPEDTVLAAEGKFSTVLPQLASFVVLKNASFGQVSAFWSESAETDQVLDSQVTEFEYYWQQATSAD